MRRCGHSSARIRRSVISAGFQVHVAMDAADNEIELGQRVIFQIHRAVAADIALDAGEHASPRPRLIHFPNLCANATARFSSRPLAMASAFE